MWHKGDPNIPDNVRVMLWDGCIVTCAIHSVLIVQDGRTPLIEAAEYGRADVVKTLIGMVAPTVLLDCQDAVVSNATCSLPLCCHTRFLLQNNRTALMYAARHGFVDIVDSLVKAGANLELTTRACTLTVRLSLNWLSLVFRCCFVMKQGGWTALFFAVKWGSYPITNLLLEAGAVVNLEDKVSGPPSLTSFSPTLTESY